MNKLRYSMFIVTVFLVLALSAVSTVPALADDETPPQPAAEETTPPVEAGSDEIPPTEQVSEEAPPTEVPVIEETALQDETVAELLATVPEGTEVVVINEEGDVVPLATEEAAQLIEIVDPMWCPAGVNPGAATCSMGYTSLTELVTDFNDGAGGLSTFAPSGNGVIWIEGGTDAGTVTPILISGLDVGFTGIANFSLTLKGGWNGCTPVCVNTVNTATPSIFDQSISIVNWNGVITLSDIVITGASGVGVYALDVESSKNITLTNVDVQDNTTDLGGAYIDTLAGTGNVVVNDSTFNGNVGIGLTVYSNGTITGKNLSANNNDDGGAFLDNSFAASAKAVTLTGSNNFKFNGLEGLYITSDGAITLSNVTAIYNSGGSGAYLDNCGGYNANEFCNNTVASAVTLKGTNNFSNNGWDGLRVWTRGAITISNITANNNGTDTNRPAADDPDQYDHQITGQEYDAYGKGVFLNNYGGLVQKAVTLTGTNTFNGNASNGLFVNASGLIKVSNLTASNNGCDLLFDTDISYCAGAYLQAYLGVTLTGFGVFEGNTENGLGVSSFFKGAVTLNSLYADGNGFNGVDILTVGATPVNVTINGTNFFNNNSADGLNVISDGMVTLNNLTANGNDADGVYVDNYTFAVTPKGVNLKGANVFNGNGDTGLFVVSSGAITTYNLTANDNDYGVYLDNCLASGPTTCGTGFTPMTITLNGMNTFNDNGQSGLEVVAWGAIKVNNLTSTFNNGAGAYLDNMWNGTTGSITVSGYGILNKNGDSGLEAYSAGAITLANLTVNDNIGSGAEIYNNFNPLKPANVTLTGVNQFNDNWFSGLEIYSHGSILLNNITANENGMTGGLSGYGVYVDNCLYNGSNCDTLTAKPITLNGVNIFNGNYDDGLYVSSLGAIKVNKVTANSNGGDGANLENQYGFMNSAITLTGYGIFNNNLDDGLDVLSNGALTMSNLTANFNTIDGVKLDNYSDTLTPVTVTLLGTNTFNGNQYDGLTVYSDGQITLNNITANDNVNGYGAYLNNTDYAIPMLLRGITVNGSNTFVNNNLDGLSFEATGNVSLTRISADLNNDGVGGAPLSVGVRGIAGGTISLTCGSMNFNEGAGYDLTAGAGLAVTLKGVYTYGNGAGDFSGPITVSTRNCPLP
jgi:hypothetical protein